MGTCVGERQAKGARGGSCDSLVPDSLVPDSLVVAIAFALQELGRDILDQSDGKG